VKKYVRSLIILCAFSIIGCETIMGPSDEVFTTRLESNLVGKPLSAITDKIGYPSDNIELPDGGKAYYWEMNFVSTDVDVMANDGSFVQNSRVCQLWARIASKTA
jgi:hypothetical protein